MSTFDPSIMWYGGIGLAAVALFLYPLVSWISGIAGGAPLIFGLTPWPTALFTIGILLLIDRRTPLFLLGIPILVSFIGGAFAWVLGIWIDFVLSILSLGGGVAILLKNRRLTRATRLTGA